MLLAKTDAVRFREFRDGDFEGVARLWRDDAGWGEMTAETWRRWYVDIPHGPALIIVGEDRGGGIVAMAAMTPARVSVDGEEHAAVHLAAPILGRSQKSLTIPSPRHPFVQLILGCEALAKERGVTVMFALPRRNFLPLLRLGPMFGLPSFPTLAVGCGEWKLDAARQMPDADRVRVSVISSFGDEYAGLWEHARSALPIAVGIRRDAAHLNYRNGAHLNLELRDRRDDTLAGFAAVRRDGLLVDFLPREPGLVTSLIAAVCRYVADPSNRALPDKVDVFKAMQTELLAPSLRELGFETSRFQFGFACRGVDPSLTARVEASRWYLTPNG